MKIADILLVSDLDGTLIGKDHQIPERNLEAIKRFKEKGGKFCVATGRSIESGRPYYLSLIHIFLWNMNIPV